MEYSIIKPEEYKLMPWKNGKGVTKELFVRNLQDTDKYLFRLSMAGVTEDGEFSDFSGYDRTLIMLEGNGIILHHSDGTVNELLKTSDIAFFSGDVKTTATLINGPVRDFNVMTLSRKCRSKVEILKGTSAYGLTGQDTFFFSHSDDGTLNIGKDQISLNRGYLLQLSTGSDLRIKISGSFIIVQIFYV